MNTSAPRLVRATDLTDSMVLLDPQTGARSFVLDHKQRTPRGSASVVWFGLDLETGRYRDLIVGARRTLAVAVEA
jgi:hypothetical protein